ncbi:MAG: amylo-alpha-1,6-glucosidase [Ignavibacteriales bacterium]
MEFGKAYWRTFEQGIQREWIVANGIGGFASSTIIGANSRRYHGLLTAALHPPVNRHLILSKLDESFEIYGKKYDIFANQTPGYTGTGYHYLQRFVINPFPTFIYSIHDVTIEKKIFMIYKKNSVVILYKISNGNDKAVFKVTPVVNFRDYHGDASQSFMRFSKKSEKCSVYIRPYDLDKTIKIKASEGTFTGIDNGWFTNMEYAAEKERGLKAVEDHYIPGYFDIKLKPLETKIITFVASLDEIDNVNGLELLDYEQERINGLIEKAGYTSDFINKMVVTADSFIAYRKSTDSKTILAGYHWFTDWGRDTMIALPGLTLVTKRFDDAKDILYTFSKYVKNGLIPNMFPDEGQEPIYNTVDAPLWYFEAVYKYLQYTNDYEFVKEKLYPSLKEIIERFVSGTSFSIKMDSDGLITAGEKGVQLTWMDAKVGDWVVTPRHGKAVEINALWYNALKVMEHLAEKLDLKTNLYTEASKIVKDSFIKEFWNEEKKCLYDVVDNNSKDGKIRPNQIIAASLSFPIIEGEKAKKVVNTVWKHLYTAYGLRSLSPEDPEYKGIYIGDMLRRDSAYHQGTVWSWLIGHFIRAYRRTEDYSEKSRVTAKQMLEAFKDHLGDACVGSVSEIFDGNEPLIPRGAVSQAWGVAEVLRSYVEDVLNN